MSRGAKVGAGIGLAFVVGMRLLVKMVSDANDWMNRCADYLSPDYIVDERERAAVCKTDP